MSHRAQHWDFDGVLSQLAKNVTRACVDCAHTVGQCSSVLVLTFNSRQRLYHLKECDKRGSEICFNFIVRLCRSNTGDMVKSVTAKSKVVIFPV